MTTAKDAAEYFVQVGKERREQGEPEACSVCDGPMRLPGPAGKLVAHAPMCETVRKLVERVTELETTVKLLRDAAPFWSSGQG